MHPALTLWETDGPNLMIGDVSLSRLADRIGRTPFYAYDRQALSRRIEALRRHFPSVHIHYAIKANPMPAIAGHLAQLIDGFDVASAGEMDMALDTGMAAEHIGFAGPGKSDEDIGRAVAAGILLEIESLGDLNRLSHYAERTGYSPRLAIRVNPDFHLKGAGMQMGGGAQQFGVDAEQVPALMTEIASRDLDFEGFHIFSGSQNLSADIIADVQQKTVQLALRLAEQKSTPLHYLNLGGGFGIPYFPKDQALDLAHVGESLEPLITDLKAQQPEVRPVIELGRYIVGEAGIYVSRVLDRKTSRGETFLVTDGGLHHHLAASGNFGQVIRRNYPVAIGNRMNQESVESVTVVGCLCTPLDLLAHNVETPAADVGDLVVIFQSGAYGASASPTAFLGHPPPVEVLV